jgi:integrase
MALSDLQIRRAKPTDKPYLLADGGRLYLKVAKSGTKSWIVRSQSGVDKSRTIGKYPAMTLLEARNIAATVDITKVSITLGQLYEAYAKTLDRSYDRPDLIRARLANNVVEGRTNWDIQGVTRKDLSEILTAIVDRGAKVQANRTLPDIKHMFNYAVERGWLETNPAELLTRKSVGGRELPRTRVLTENELKQLIAELQKPRLHLRTRLALGLLLATGQRAGEVLGFETSELVGFWWYVPADRTKSRRLQKVYLSPQARAVLKYASHFLGDPPFTMDHRTLSHAVRTTPGATYTPHDLRRTMATWLAENGTPPHVIEKMLNHALGGVMAVYNRAEYLADRRTAWLQWGRYLSSLR